MKKLVNRGELGPSDLVWHTEADGWMRVAQARKLLITGNREGAPAGARASEGQPDTGTASAGITDLADHRAQNREAGGDAASPANGADDEGADASVTAGIVDRLRRRMEEITGEQSPAPAARSADESDDEEQGSRGLADKLAERAAALNASLENDKASGATPEASEPKHDPAVPPAPPEPPPAPPQPPTPPEPPAEEPVPEEPEVEEPPSEEPEEIEPPPVPPSPPPVEPPSREPPQHVQASSAASGSDPDDEDASDAPSKQVARPVRNNRLPPRALIADFGPPQSSTGAENKPVRNRKDRLASARRLGSRRPQQPANDARREPAGLRRSPEEVIEPAPASPAPPSATPEAAPPTPPEPETPLAAAPPATPEPPAEPEEKSVSKDEAPRPDEIAGRTPPPEAEPADTVPAARTDRSRETTPPAQQLPPTAEPPVAKPNPRDLARAAAEALRRERSRGKTAEPEKPAEEVQAPEEPGEPEPDLLEAAAPEEAGPASHEEPDHGPDQPEEEPTEPEADTDNVEPLIHGIPPSQRGEPVSDRPPELSRLPGRRGARPTAQASEPSAVRSLPTRTGATRKKGAAKSRRRDSNMVPMARQTLSARNESMRGRHARGRYSLARSYWVNLVAVSLVLFGIGAAGLWYLASKAQVFHLLGLAAVIAVLLVLIAPWQLSGVWRSANEHARRKDGSVIARVAQASLFLFAAAYIALLGALLVPVGAAVNLLLQGVDDRAYRVKVNPAGTIVQVDGKIEPGLTGQIDQALRRSPRIHTLVLNSQGGYLFEARELRDLVEASPIRATYTRNSCLGACVLPFMAADERVAEVGAVLQFGGPTGSDGFLAMVDQRLGLEADARYLADRGLDPALFDIRSAAGYTSTDRHNDLVDTGVLTAVSVGNRVFRSDNIDDVTKAQVERSLLSVPFFDTIRNIEPQLFTAFRDGVAASNVETVIENDGLGERTFDSAGPLVEHVKANYLPIAPDRAADDLMAVLTALGTELQAENPAACVALVSPSLDTLGRPIAPHLETDRRAAYFQVFDQLISDANADPQTPAPPERATEISAPVIEGVAAGNAETAAFLAEGAAGGLSVEQQCAAALDYLTALRALPLAERSIAFRHFAARNS